MSVHILNGDCLQATLQAENALIVREMFLEGPLTNDSWEAFFKNRAIYLENTYSIPSDEYQKKSVSEFQKMQEIANHSEVYLWFDYDLFCLINLLLVLQLISQNKTLKLFLIRPLRKRSFRIWHGFGQHTKAELMQAYSLKKSLQRKEVKELLCLWNKLGKKAVLKHHQHVPFLQKHLQDYPVFSQAKKIEARWGLTEEQIKQILYR
jgi:hypothetical protein